MVFRVKAQDDVKGLGPRSESLETAHIFFQTLSRARHSHVLSFNVLGHQAQKSLLYAWLFGTLDAPEMLWNVQ